MVDMERMQRTLVAIRQAKVMGLDLGTEPPPVEEIEKMIEHKKIMSGQKSDWIWQMIAAGRRRKRIAAAYLVGASQGQLAMLIGVTRQTVHQIVTREVPLALRQKASSERVGKKAQLTYTQVSGMLNAIEENDDGSVIALAAKMQQALATVSDDDSEDEILIPTS